MPNALRLPCILLTSPDEQEFFILVFLSFLFWRAYLAARYSSEIFYAQEYSILSFSCSSRWFNIAIVVQSLSPV